MYLPLHYTLKDICNILFPWWVCRPPSTYSRILYELLLTCGATKSLRRLAFDTLKILFAYKEFLDQDLNAGTLSFFFCNFYIK